MKENTRKQIAFYNPDENKNIRDGYLVDFLKMDPRQYEY
jgi:hypothetical protein